MAEAYKGLLDRLLNLDKEKLDDLAKQYSVSLNKEPKKRDSKLVESIKSKGAFYKKIYQNLEDDIEQLHQIDILGEFQREQYMVRIINARELPNPAERDSQLSQIYQQLRHDIITSLGLRDIKENPDLSAEEKLMIATHLGARYFED